MAENLDEDVPFEALPPPPAARPTLRRAVEAMDLTGDLSTEWAFLSAILGDPEGILFAEAAGLPSSAFQNDEVSRCWAALHGGLDVTDILAIAQKAKVALPRLVECLPLDRAGAAFSTHHRFLADRARRAELKRLGVALAENPDLADTIAARIAAMQRTDEPRGRAVPISSFRYPTASDPNVLLGEDDYLGRGGGMLFVSHAGAGKSSWIMDACMSWAIDRPWMGFRSHGALKSLIIQAEDSDRYIGKIFSSFEFVNKLTADQAEQLERNCVIKRLKGVSGAKFFAELRRLVAEENPDLVVINPLYLYADGDITRSEFAQPFIVGLDEVNREEKFAYILVHHTGKPSQKQNGKRAEVEDWESVYMGFGSSYLANWPRCSALLEPVTGASGRFRLKLGKGRYNAGIMNKIPQGAGFRLEAAKFVSMRHSTEKMKINGVEKPVFYWEPDEDAPEVTSSTKGLGRPKKNALENFLAAFPVGVEKAQGFRPLHRSAVQIRPISIGAFVDMLDEAVEVGAIAKDSSNPRQPKYYKAS